MTGHLDPDSTCQGRVSLLGSELWIENAPQVLVVEDAKEWFVVSGNKEVSASLGEDMRLFQAEESFNASDTLCWRVTTSCIVCKLRCGKY